MILQHDKKQWLKGSELFDSLALLLNNVKQRQAIRQEYVGCFMLGGRLYNVSDTRLGLIGSVNQGERVDRRERVDRSEIMNVGEIGVRGDDLEGFLFNPNQRIARSYQPPSRRMIRRGTYISRIYIPRKEE